MRSKNSTRAKLDVVVGSGLDERFGLHRSAASRHRRRCTMRHWADIATRMALAILLAGIAVSASAREHEAQTAQITVQAIKAGCPVDVDAAAVGTTDANRQLVITAVEPGDHYLHVDCGEHTTTYFISPQPGQNVLVQPPNEGDLGSSIEVDPLEAAQTKIELRRLVQQAVQFRSGGRLDEAVAALRQAIKLDQDNSDLHRELGITFLLAKEWKRARTEMIEAIRHDQTDADAHNGLGYALEKLGDLDGALKEYRTATHLEPDDPTYRTHYFDALSRVAGRQTARK